MTVFVLTITWGPNREIVGVFSSLEKAAEFRQKHPAVGWSGYAEYDEPEAVDIDADTYPAVTVESTVVSATGIAEE